jgi:rare lipoprotein A (peptidoglycan hydrolase)
MRTTYTRQILLALIAVSACAGVLAAGALASPGSVTGSGGVLSLGPASAPLPAHVRKTGIATWFGPGFYGQTTACGQTLTPLVVGVANRTLPCGTLVKVSYHGRRLTVPVIDRGPYGATGADWDLTSEAARTLGVQDTVRIGARVVGRVANSPLLGLPPVSPLAAATGGAAVS